MGHSGGQQGESVELFGLHFLFRLFAGPGDIPNQHDVPKVGFTFFGYRGEVEVQVAVFRVEDLEITTHRAAVGLHQVAPVNAADDFVQRFALGEFGRGSEKTTTGMVDEADSARGIEQEDALLEGFEDLLEETFFANQSGKKRLYFLRLDLIKPGENLIEDRRFQSCDRLAQSDGRCNPRTYSIIVALIRAKTR